MLQVSFIRQNKELVLERLAIKRFAEPQLIDAILSLDDQRKNLTFQYDQAKASINTASKEIGQLLKNGESDKAETRKREVSGLSEGLPVIEKELARTERELHDVLVRIPNLPSPLVPPGKTPEDNVVVREGGVRPVLPTGALAHWDLAKKYKLIDFEWGTKITGAGFPVYMNRGAKLQRALIQYFLDYNTESGYQEYQVPLMVNEASAYGTGQLPDKEAQMYVVPEDGFYLIPTAEVPLTNLYRDDMLRETDLPVRLTGYTPCFRREAGSYGKDVRGLNRLHQFDKVELVQLVQPDRSYAALEAMVLHVERLLQALQLQYRILRLCGGDMSFTSALTYDFEVFSAAQEKWLEVSSVSNFEAYQTHRMKIRYKDAKGKTQLLHSLNGSSLALPRIVACLLENHQTEDGIALPEVLHRYYGGIML